MSLLLIIIPILITNLAFYHFKAIELNVPGIDNSAETSDQKKDRNKKKNVILQLSIDPKSINLDLVDEDSGGILENILFTTKDSGITKMKKKITSYQKKYKKLNTIMISADLKLKYEKLINILDKCKKPPADLKNAPKFTFVLLPRGEQ